MLNTKQMEAMYQGLINYLVPIDTDPTEKYETAFVEAINKKMTFFANILLEVDAIKDVNLIYDGSPLIFIAIRNNCIDVVEALIGKGADINAKINKFNSILNIDIIETALMVAIHSSATNIAKLLIENGATIELEDNPNATPLSYAIYYGNPEIVKMLIERGANVNPKVKNASPLICALFYYYCDSEIAKILIERGANVNAKSEIGNMPLALAVERFNDNNDNNDIIKILIEAGADVNSTNSNGVTALKIAIDGNKHKFAKLLIKAGADIDNSWSMSDEMRQTVKKACEKKILTLQKEFQSWKERIAPVKMGSLSREIVKTISQVQFDASYIIEAIYQKHAKPDLVMARFVDNTIDGLLWVDDKWQRGLFQFANPHRYGIKIVVDGFLNAKLEYHMIPTNTKYPCITTKLTNSTSVAVKFPANLKIEYIHENKLCCRELGQIYRKPF